MFPIILNSVDDDDDADLLSEANNRSTLNEQSPLFQDNLRCTVGQRIARRFSFSTAARPSQLNQSLQPGERIIEIKSESEDEADDENAHLIQHRASSSTAHLNERTNLLANDDHYRFQRFRPIREYDLTANSDPHSDVRIQRNYQVLKSKRRVTFPICFFVGLYIAFLVLSSAIFTMFEQRIVKTDEFFELQKRLMTSLSEEQYEMMESLIRQSVHIQKAGLDAMEILLENKLIILDERLAQHDRRYNQERQTAEPGYKPSSTTTNHRSTTKTPSGMTNRSVTLELSAVQQQPNTITFSSAAAARSSVQVQPNNLRSRKSYNWDFQQALFYVVSIATTIGYVTYYVCSLSRS